MKKLIIIIIGLALLLVGGYTLFQEFGNYGFKTEYDLNSAMEFVKNNGSTIIVNNTNPVGEVVNTEKVDINTEIDQSLATGLINYWSNSWPYAPIVDSNVRINNDGTVEYFGFVDISRALKFASVTGIPQNVVDTVSNYVKPFGSKFPIYAKGNIEIVNNTVIADVSDVKVSIASVTGLIKENRNSINSFVTAQLSKDSSYSVKTLKVQNNKFVVDAVLPKTVEYK